LKSGRSIYCLEFDAARRV
jgi:hypothetical protein